ncbi:MAG TPA: DUF1772 domain-containing protein [Gammaproteobacteria bacterium]|nr:DUF1772 domain-containing protein [Gammaproteobacteria bacterium]
MKRSMLYDVVFFVALLATALALGAALAHALELPNKIHLPKDQYFVVQQAYNGWNRLAYLLLVELLSMIALAFMSRRDPRVFWAVVAAICCFAAAQAVFWIFTYPANVATANWTRAPESWEALRARWEYSHAAGAAFQTLAMASLIVAVLGRGRG